MTRIIDIGGKQVEMHSNAATPIYFKHIFRDDIIRHLNSDEDGATRTEVVMQLAFVLAMQAIKTSGELRKLQEAQYIEWLERFEYSDLISVHADVIALYLGLDPDELRGTVEGDEKNAQGEQSES